jgi:O-antigen/teichoic acid export membrane protein
MRDKLLSSFGYTVVSSGIFFGFNLFLAKYLGANEYGQISYYLSFIQILALLISFNYAALYMGNKITREDDNTFSLFVSIESLLFLIVGFPAFFVIQKYTNSYEVTVLILFIAYMSNMVSVVGLEFNANKKVKESILFAQLIPRALLVGLFLLAIVLGMASAKVYLYLFLMSLLIVFIYFIFYFKPTFYIKKEIFYRAWKFYLLGIIGSSLSYIAQIYQKEYGSYTQLASLAIALIFISGLSLVGSVLNKFALPKIHEAYKSYDISKIGHIYKTQTFLSSIINLPILILLIFFIDMISDYIGEGYSALPICFYILALGYIFDLLTGITGTILRATENEHYEIYNEIFRFVVGIGLILILSGYKFGIVYALSLSMVGYNIIKFIQVYRLYQLKPLDYKSLKILLLYIGVLSLILYITKVTVDSFILALALVGVFYWVLSRYLKNQIDWSLYQ